LTYSFRLKYGPGFGPASNRNEYQEYLLGGNGSRCLGLTTDKKVQYFLLTEQKVKKVQYVLLTEQKVKKVQYVFLTVQKVKKLQYVLLTEQKVKKVQYV
jgi:hypothetical protein